MHYYLKFPHIWNSIENRFREIKGYKICKLSLGANLIENYAAQVTSYKNPQCTQCFTAYSIHEYEHSVDVAI